MSRAPEFQPPAWLRGGMAQTIWANYAPRGASARQLHGQSVAHTLPTADGDRIRVHWNEAAPEAPVLVVLHGLTGCAQSGQVLGLAAKGLRAGFTVVRADLRNALGTTPSIGVGHAGRSEDVITILDHVAALKPGRRVVLIGYSLGGNVALKTLGEMGAEPRGVAAATAISTPIDLSAACTAIDAPDNRVFRRYFVGRLKRIIAARTTPGSPYAGIDLRDVRSIREFDGRLVAPLSGFDSAEDYYARCSALPRLRDIRVPTLLIQAVDDPFIPFAAYEHPSIAGNTSLSLLTPEHGGHTGFWGRGGIESDRFWAEHRAIEFCVQAAFDCADG
jgi:hypothetical protein